MAAEERSITNNGTTDALYRAWGSAVSDLWQDNGLTKTSDTGQINWETVTRPTGGSTTVTVSAGYEVFRLTTDTNQTSFPVFIKVVYFYGTSTSSYHQTGFSFQVGTGTDGAGNLTGITTLEYKINGREGTATQPHYCSGGDGRFCYAGHWEEAATNATSDNEMKNTIFMIERFRDNTGSPTDDGVYIFHTGIQGSGTFSNPGFTTLYPDDWVSPTMRTRIGAVVPPDTGNRVDDLYLFTHHPADYALFNPVISNLFYYYGDLTTGNNISVDMYGTTRTYKPLGRNATSTSAGTMGGMIGHSTSGFLMLWE